MAELSYLDYQEIDNPVKDLFNNLIDGIKKNGNYGISLTDLPDELNVIVQELEQQGVNFSQLLEGKTFLKQLIEAYNDAFHNKIELPIDNINSTISETLNYTEDVQQRRIAWSKLAEEFNIDENEVNITNEGIDINGVGGFELDDREDASYNKLKNSGDLDNLPKFKIWKKFVKFIENWGREKQEIFLTKVMNMDTTKKGDWNFYLSSSRFDDDGVQGLNVNRNDVNTVWSNRNYTYSVRFFKN